MIIDHVLKIPVVQKLNVIYNKWEVHCDLPFIIGT